MVLKIKRGDECALAVRVLLGGQEVAVDDVDTAEFCLGRRLRKLYPGEAEYSASEGAFLLPLTQEETFSLPPDTALPLDVRVKFVNGDVLGSTHMGAVVVYDAISEVVL